ncbi:polysaccharide biosynthesis/export family protein [Yoonia sp. GPGPB17]|uniref:polysaccharide biosynthesis/export family protein n=1 Tax=Yoonia sp. GPGPB17 TaxID=3026147 RepID=UPI0030C62ECB
MRRWCLGILTVVTLSACGTAYISPQVTAADGKVRIVPLTAESVLVANRDIRTPEQIPDAFFQTAGSPSALRGAGAAPPPSLTEQQRPASLTTRPPPTADPGPYRIGVGDVLLLATRSSGDTVEELSGLLAAQNSREGYTVQDDGAIAVPDVGRVMLAGLTLEGAEAQLFQSLVENRIDPTFSLEIAEFNSKRVSIGGAVGNPAIVPIALTPVFLDEAIALSGGIATPDIDFASIRIYRGGTLYQIPLVAYLRDPSLQKTRLLAGDSIFVDTAFELERAQAYFEEQITLAQFRQQGRVQALAELTAEVELRRAALAEARSNFQEQIALDAVARDFVYLTGEVTKPGRFPLPFGRQATLADALFAEGGFSSETGNPGQIYVLRSSDEDFGAITAWHLNAENVSNLLLATRLNLLPNDIVFIAEQPVTRWNRVVQQLVPSLLTTSAGIAAN